MELDRNGSVNARKRKNKWTEAEDLQLIAAVQKYGEGNWAAILRSESTWQRSTSQLSQRWAVIRRKDDNLNLTTTTTTTPSSGGVQLSEAQRATRIALNLALGLPIKNSFIKSGEGTSLKQNVVHTGEKEPPTRVSTIRAGKEPPKKQVKQEKKAVLLNQEAQESADGESERLKAEEIIWQEQMFFKLAFKDIFDANTDCASGSEWCGHSGSS